MLRDISQQQDPRAGVACLLEERLRLSCTQRPGLVDEQDGPRVEPIAPPSRSASTLATVRASIAASSPRVRAASPATATPITR
jgi:hypothetical protein